MNKKLINALLIGSLMVGSVGTFTACKDYDDDINRLDSTTSSLESQISQLKTALDGYKQTADQAAANAQQALQDAAAAQKTGDEALAAAKVADANAQSALAAAAQAKADALQAITDAITPLKASVEDNASAIRDLLSRVTAIEGNVAAIQKVLETLPGQVEKNINDIAALQEAVKLQQAALEQYGISIGALQESVKALGLKDTELEGKIAANAAAITTLKSDLTALQGKVDKCATKDELTALQQEFNNKIAEVWQKLPSQIVTYISGRLTSVTLVPDLYVGGIPTIEFESAIYKKMELGKNGWERSDELVGASGTGTTVRYRLNPTTVGLTDIKADQLSYVSNIAEVRSRANSLVNPVSCSLKDGILTVNVTKGDANNILDLPGVDLNKVENLPEALDNKYFVALNVPIADKHLFTNDGETSASVYSEYTRVKDTWFQPVLSFTEDVVKRNAKNAIWNGEFANGCPADKDAVYKSDEAEYIAKSIVYNETYDLDLLIAGRKIHWTLNGPDGNPLVYMSHEELADYGFDVVYHVATAPYELGAEKTNQQEFAKINGSILTPVTPQGEANNQAIIGRTPIICALLVDTRNNNVADCGYFKLQFTQVDMEPVEFTFNPFNTNFECNDDEALTVNVTWKNFQQTVLEKLGENGMSENDFYKIYEPGKVTFDGPGTVSATINEPGVNTTVFDWTIDYADLKPAFDGSETFTATVTFTDVLGLHPDIICNLSWTVTYPSASAAKLGATDATYWVNEMMKIVVVPMPANWTANDPTATYKSNIFQGRIKPYVNGILSCNQWWIDYSSEGAQGGALVNNDKVTGDADPADNVYFTIDPASPAGQTLACNGGDVLIDWTQNIIAGTAPTNVFATSTLKVLPILTLNGKTGLSITDNNRAQDITLQCSLTDAYNNSVAGGTGTSAAAILANRYWGYYECQDPVYDQKQIMVTEDTNGTNPKSLAYYNMTATIETLGNNQAKLTYVNEGAGVQNILYLQIPVSVQHKFGTLSGNVYVTIKPNSAIN